MVAQQFRGELNADDSLRTAGAGTVDPVAYQEYLLGRSHLWRFKKDDLRHAITHFERATTIDPSYASAYAGLAYAWWVRGVFTRTGAMLSFQPHDASIRTRVHCPHV